MLFINRFKTNMKRRACVGLVFGGAYKKSAAVGTSNPQGERLIKREKLFARTEASRPENRDPSILPDFRVESPVSGSLHTRFQPGELKIRQKLAKKP
jgi:hypothetical protein